MQTALTHAAPDRVEDVLSRCSERKGNGYAMNEKKKFRAAPWLAAACLALVLASGSALYYFSSAAVIAEVEPELDERAHHYEVSFDSGRWEYDYTIDAVTGAVLAWEKDD